MKLFLLPLIVSVAALATPTQPQEFRVLYCGTNILESSFINQVCVGDVTGAGAVREVVYVTTTRDEKFVFPVLSGSALSGLTGAARNVELLVYGNGFVARENGRPFDKIKVATLHVTLGLRPGNRTLTPVSISGHVPTAHGNREVNVNTVTYQPTPRGLD